MEAAVTIGSRRRPVFGTIVWRDDRRGVARKVSAATGI
jgi:hypothetical protein